MDEENLTKLLQAFSNCNYIEFVKVFSVVHGFDATMEFCKNAFYHWSVNRVKFWGNNNSNNNNNNSNNNGNNTNGNSNTSTGSTLVDERPAKRQAIRTEWEDPNYQGFVFDYDTNFSPSTRSFNSSSDNHSSNSNNSINSINNNGNNVRRTSKGKRPMSYYRQRSITNIQDLPNEIKLLIFSFLKYSDILVISLVSKSWNEYSLRATTELTVENKRALVGDIVNRRIYKHSNYLKKIKSCHCKLFNNTSIRVIIDNCTNLNELQLIKCQYIVDSDIELVISRLPQLKRLALHSDVNFTSKTFDSLSRSKLEEIELGGFTRVPLDSFSKLSEIPTLKALDLNGITTRDAKELCRQISGCIHLKQLRLQVATESSMALLPFLGNLTLLSIAEWVLEDVVTTTTNQETQSIVTTISHNSSGSSFSFLQQCKKMENLEITGSTEFVLKDLSSLYSVADTLRVLEFDFQYSNELDDHQFKKVFSSLTKLERLFISKFNLSGECWEAFSKIPNLYNLSLCCIKMNNLWVNRGLEHLSNCKNLQKLSIINSTDQWIEINEKSFESLLKPTSSFINHLIELRLGGSRGGGWLLNENIFRTIGEFRSLQLLDLSNSRGINEHCFEYLSKCTELECLEGSIRAEENTFKSTIADWCGTGTLVNCPALRKVSIDIKLPHVFNSEIKNIENNRSFNLMAKISKDHDKI
ncbi:hypothetical protein DICPUDRAFT_96758 [Dictyostelium purpureum]|uniref:F-box domain-containing protein n=1 Tax=Dictyostelium purpureum TaxID=5786 RepID=F0ZAY9_DICPU|nr:uncharacterized protein DICPUDRAFT_96758 [Dictyostelium purpureum]EGC38912.1 hypothetical protein DICPUDRAFT_96758 [Dictyostelium purpureum]|eukprot:XP_003284592.1 hypothetical protein DICPUDRAFT_96758 [Dictyostelium purpureum]